MAGPAGCLQYFTATSGAIKSFNFPTSTSTITAEATHLANQKYTICIRKGSGMCTICYNPLDAGTAGAIDQGTFGLSVIATAGSATSAVDTQCTQDFLTIRDGGNTTTPATWVPAADNQQRYCGRFLNTDQASTAHNTICSRSVPFNVGVHFDGVEQTAGGDETDDETLFPSGSVGFFLEYAQTSC